MRTRTLLALACTLAACSAAAAQSTNVSTVFSQRTPAFDCSSGSCDERHLRMYLTTHLVHAGLAGDLAVACPSWDAGSQSWVAAPDAPKHGAIGGETPRRGIIDGISYAICYDATGDSSGQEVQQAVQAGAPRAAAAAYALLRDADRACGTSNPDAADRAYQHAVAAVAGLPGDFDCAAEWLASLVAGADVAGIPACASVALVDDATGEAVAFEQVHTGGSG